MTKYIIEITKEGNLSKDNREIAEALVYNRDYLGGDIELNYVTKEGLCSYDYDEDVIIVGGMDYTNTYIQQNKNQHFKSTPIKIRGYLLDKSIVKRDIVYGDKQYVLDTIENLGDNDTIFIKDISGYKGLTVIYDKSNKEDLEKELEIGYGRKYMISSYVDYESEYRVFVCNGLVVGMKHYSGDYLIYPSNDVIKDIVNAYEKESNVDGVKLPKSYSFDIGIDTQGNTSLIEIHPMVSLGLYGFKNAIYIPTMIAQGYKYYRDSYREDEINWVTRLQRARYTYDILTKEGKKSKDAIKGIVESELGDCIESLVSYKEGENLGVILESEEVSILYKDRLKIDESKYLTGDELREATLNVLEQYIKGKDN